MLLSWIKGTSWNSDCERLKNGYSKCSTETNLEQIPIDDERTKHEWEHEESIVEEEAIFAQFFALEFLFGVHAIGCCENIV